MKAQDLKNSILQLAIQGKLVPQDPNDESAEVLYAKIQAEKQKLIKEGKIKKDKPLPQITDDEIPFQIPQTWKWVRLGDISSINGGFAFKSTHYQDTGIRVIRISDFDENGFKNNKIVRYKYTEDLKQYLIEQNNIIMAMTGGTVGKSYFVLNSMDPLVSNQRVATVKINTEICPEYINIVILAPVIQKLIQISKNSTNDNISMDLINNFIIPLPPLAEQKRIVAKIEELEPLVKQYDKAETELSVLNDSFPEQLKKSILQYAIQGKLVTQDANDESAEVLYTKIQAEKQKLIKEGKIKKNKPLSPITDDEIPFAIPPSWKWVRLKDLGIINPRNNLSDSIEVTFLPMNCIYSDFYKDIDTSNKKKWGEVKSGYTHIAENDVIMAKITPCFENGKSAIAKNLLNGYGAATTEIHVFRRVIELNLNYILVYLKSPFFMDYATKHMTGTAGQKRVPQNIFAEYFFPLPPLAEQHRIVAKVTELMQYCEKLKI